MTKNVNIIILNYNGRKLLEKYLPSIIKASKKSMHHCIVSIIDNKSEDDSTAFVRKNYSDVILYEASENKVLCSFNEYLKKIDDNIVIFLNNDIRVDEGFVDPLVSHFEDKDVLFVAPKEYSMSGIYQGNLNRLVFKFGLLYTAVQKENYDKAQYDSSVHGGAFDRAKFLELGGYDDLYLPGIFEDLDLCYRGWKRGWKGIYEPKSFYYHEGSTSFNEVYGQRIKRLLAFRNTFLFFWKNITSNGMFLTHVICLPILLLFNILRGRWLFIKGFFQALLMLDKVIKKRSLAVRQFYINDKEAINRTRMPYLDHY